MEDENCLKFKALFHLFLCKTNSRSRIIVNVAQRVNGRVPMVNTKVNGRVPMVNTKVNGRVPLVNTKVNGRLPMVNTKVIYQYNE